MRNYIEIKIRVAKSGLLLVAGVLALRPALIYQATQQKTS